MRRLVEGFDGVPAEQLVGPGDEVVDILHHHRFLIGADAEAGDDVRVEWRLSPLVDLFAELIFFLAQVRILITSIGRELKELNDLQAFRLFV